MAQRLCVADRRPVPVDRATAQGQANMRVFAGCVALLWPAGRFLQPGQGPFFLITEFETSRDPEAADPASMRHGAAKGSLRTDERACPLGRGFTLHVAFALGEATVPLCAQAEDGASPI